MPRPPGAWGEAKCGDWRDRLLGGVFSREPARARAYHDARRSYAGAVAAVRRRKRRLARFYWRIDRRIRPLMSELDRDYGRLPRAIKQCDLALRECRDMRQLIVAATASARTASEDPGQNDKAAREAERARRRHQQLVGKIRDRAHHVGPALDSASRSVRAAVGEARHIPWDAALLDQLPRGRSARSGARPTATATQPGRPGDRHD